jgi:hypothetical protein
MIKLQGNFSYRYVNLKSVYLISNSKPTKSTLMNYYSVPHTPQQIGSLTNNVLLGFEKESLCLDSIGELKVNLKDESIIAVCMPIDEAKYIAQLMGIPIVVIINKKIKDKQLQYEVHFTHGADRI